METKNIINFFIRNKRSILSFLSVGALAALIYFVIFTVLWKELEFCYEYAITAAYLSSVIFHFIANKHITFRNTDHRFLAQVIRYVSLAIMNYLITMIVVYVVVTSLHFSPYLGIFLSIGVTVGFGYLMSLFWVFRMSENGS